MTKSKPINFFNAWNSIKYGEKIRLKNRGDRTITKKENAMLVFDNGNEFSFVDWLFVEEWEIISKEDSINTLRDDASRDIFHIIKQLELETGIEFNTPKIKQKICKKE
jgi:hypothetical protein